MTQQDKAARCATDDAVTIRAGTASDVAAAMEMIEAARAYFKRSGIDQWQDGYPDQAAVLRDFAQGCWYVAEAGGRVAATFMAALEHEPTYDTIENGAWRTDCGARYGVLHRIAVHEAYKGRGIGAAVVRFMAQRFAPLGAVSLRGDTHADNVGMRRMLEKNGFVRCGVIRLADGAPRDAFEALLGSGGVEFGATTRLI